MRVRFQRSPVTFFVKALTLLQDAKTAEEGSQNLKFGVQQSVQLLSKGIKAMNAVVPHQNVLAMAIQRHDVQFVEFLLSQSSLPFVLHRTDPQSERIADEALIGANPQIIDLLYQKIKRDSRGFAFFMNEVRSFMEIARSHSRYALGLVLLAQAIKRDQRLTDQNFEAFL